jgi:transposase-like protein
MKAKNQYTEDYKEQALVKVYNRGDRTIRSIAEELNINLLTLKNWMKQTTPPDKSRTARREKSPQEWRPDERLSALQESYGLAGEALHAWCRERGVFSHHLEQWKAEFCASGGQGESREDALALRALKVENQRLERELNRKEKALAEAAALLVLQKKYRALLGGEVE